MLLIEAGPDHPGIADADRLGDQMRFAATLTDWAIDASFVPGGATLNYPQGRKTGGGSAVNGAFAVRGVHGDYERWAAVAGDEWSWPHLLRVLCRLETDQDFARRRSRHRRPGSRRALAPRGAPAGASRRFSLRSRTTSIPWVDDLNAPAPRGSADAHEPARRRPHVDGADLPATRQAAGEPHGLVGHRGDAGAARAWPRHRCRVPAQRSAATGERLACRPLCRRAPIADAVVAVGNRPGSPPGRGRRSTASSTCRASART